MEEKLVKGKECIHCKKMFGCKGHPRGTLCVCFENNIFFDEKIEKSSNAENRNERRT